MSLREDLIKAKALIRTPARWRKSGSLGYGRMYASNACYEATGNPTVTDFLYEHLPDNFKRQHKSWECPGLVGKFNDDPDTTHADVMALFDRAIEAATSERWDAAADTRIVA